MNRLFTISLLLVLIVILLTLNSPIQERYQAPEPLLDLSNSLESSLVRQVVTYSQVPPGPTGSPGPDATQISLRQILSDFLSETN